MTPRPRTIPMGRQAASAPLGAQELRAVASGAACEDCGMSYLRLSLLIPLLLAACDDDATEVTPDAGESCQTLSVGERDLAFNFFGQLTGVSYGVDGRTDRLRVELYDSTTGGLPPLSTGSFDLAAPPNDNLATCQHCVWLPVGWDEVSPLE